MKTKLHVIFTHAFSWATDEQKSQIDDTDAEEIFKDLGQREVEILEYRFMQEPKTLTLTKTGQKFGVTGTRIRQLQCIALAKLRRGVWRIIKQKNTPPVDDENLRVNALSVETLDLSIRTSNCLNNMNIETIGQIRSRTCAEMLKIRNFGKKSLREIHDAMMQRHKIDTGWYTPL